MEEVIAGLQRFTFAFEEDVEMQKGVGLLPFQGMDKSGSAVCTFFRKELCGKGKRCPFRHDSGGRTVVCKHWLRGLCKKGDQCHFLHQYDVARMPECYFYSKFGDCNNKECSFLHVKPASKTQDCPWYDQGFCKNGPLCKYRHIHRVMCINYLAGFCPEGPKCQFTHPKMNLLLFSPRYVKVSAGRDLQMSHLVHFSLSPRERRSLVWLLHSSQGTFTLPHDLPRALPSDITHHHRV
ncbi:putative cleavage and polyadenylation specificity factor subunit 4-like protein [Elephas maximus indicus]|uniref:putative cleavage and polyadenylation specificity factor subunit 4-like protein n=1 Tax=Elephas maximus indicus TaxID=99487 RepID=UPI0021170587|nr:putative cleavage and polyadenylation specificity factor subunit 4-like protein [Elephas maximus indicus]